MRHPRRWPHEGAWSTATYFLTSAMISFTAFAVGRSFIWPVARCFTSTLQEKVEPALRARYAGTQQQPPRPDSAAYVESLRETL
ncbi:MAG: hypothetical protein WC740_13015 [Verrucomicrobiia bacterium]